MKKFYLLTKTLLVATLLMVGASNAWGATKNLYSQDFQSFAVDANFTTVPGYWQHSGASVQKIVDNSGNKYLTYQTGTGSTRNAAINFNISKFSAGDNWTVSFDAALTPGNKDAGMFLAIVGANGSATAANAWSQSTGNLFSVTNAGASSTSYTVNVGAYTLEDALTLTSGSNYHYVLNWDGTNINLTITKDGEVTPALSTSKAYSSSDNTTYGNPKAIFWVATRYYGTTNIDNILVTEDVDEEVVSDPTIGDPVYAGANRTVTITSGESSASNAVTTYYTIDGTDPSASNYEGSFTTASKDVTITSSCTLKAISISSTDVESSVASRAITAGKITLNAPTFTMTAYSAGNYTVEITSNQSDLDYVPASPVIKYSIDGGSEETYSSAIAVPAGSTVAAHVEEDNYNNSSAEEWETGLQPNLPVNWTQNYVGIVKGDVTLSNDGESYQNCIVSEAGDNYCVYSSDGTSAFTNANAGFQVYYHKTSPRKWMVRESTGGGGMYNFTAGNAGVAIANLTVGQIVKVEWTTSAYGGFTHNSGVTKLDNISYGSVGYYEATADGTAYFTAARNAYVKNITVYDITVSKTVNATLGWGTYCSPYALDFSSDIANLTGAYLVTGGKDGKLALSEITGTIPANTGILLEGSGEVNIPVAASSSTNVSSNKLVGVTTVTSGVAAGIYVLLYGVDDISGPVGFYKTANAFTIGANTAYLPADFTGGTAREAYFFDGVTGVDAVEVAPKAVAKEGKFIVDGKLRIFSKGKMFNANGQLVK